MNNQQIKISSFLVLCVCFSALLLFLSERQESHDKLAQKAFKRIDIYAQRLIEKKFMEDTKTPPARTMASAKGEKLDGLVGLDPWGHPFQYFVKKDLLIIWSKGPNNELDTSIDQVASNHKVFNGDDFGKVIKF